MSLFKLFKKKNIHNHKGGSVEEMVNCLHEDCVRRISYRKQQDQLYCKVDNCKDYATIVVNGTACCEKHYFYTGVFDKTIYPLEYDLYSPVIKLNLLKLVSILKDIEPSINFAFEELKEELVIKAVCNDIVYPLNYITKNNLSIKDYIQFLVNKFQIAEGIYVITNN